MSNLKGRLFTLEEAAEMILDYAMDFHDPRGLTTLAEDVEALLYGIGKHSHRIVERYGGDRDSEHEAFEAGYVAGDAFSYALPENIRLAWEEYQEKKK